MPITSAHFSDLVSPALQEAFWIGYGATGPSRRTSLIPTVYDVRSSRLAQENVRGVGVLGSDGWNFEDSGRVQYDDPNQGDKTTFTHAEFAKGVLVRRKFVDDNLFDVLTDQASALGDSLYRKREKSGASVFNNAFTSTTNDDGFSTLGADGVVLCSASHPQSDDDGTTWSNTGTTALSKAAVSSTRISMMDFEDDRGDIMDVMPDTILVPPDLEDTGLEITKSMLDPTSANNAINPQAGRFRLLVWHYLTDANNWFMLDSSRQRQFLRWYERIPVEFAREEDFDTLIAKFRAYNRYSYGWVDPRFIYGHNVT
jgi:hypothetical protein